MAGPQQSIGQPKEWREKIEWYFPNALSETYCVPPVHFNKVSYRRKPVPGTEEEALVPEFTSKDGRSRSSGGDLGLKDRPEADVPEENKSSAACGGDPSVDGKPSCDSVKLITSVEDIGLETALDRQAGIVVQSSSSSTSSLGCLSMVALGSPVILTENGTNQTANDASQVTGTGGKKKKKKKKKCCKKKGASSPTISSSLSSSTSPAASEPQVSRQLPHCLFHTEDIKQLARFEESDTHDDFAQNHVVTNLQALGRDKREPMFIVSQLSFGNYLNQPAYAAAVEQCHLNLPKDLDQEDIPYSRGEADFLLIHRRYGVLIGEVKSVGRSQATPDEGALARRIAKGITQLERARKVMGHLLSDVASGITVRTTLALPYIRRDRLQQFLETTSELSESLLECLGAKNVDEAVDLCLCADQLSNPNSYWDVTPDSLGKLSDWWTKRWANDSTLHGPETDDNYLDIVARFVGPASTVAVNSSVLPRAEVRTTGQAVAEAGLRLARLVLTPRQIDILNQNQPQMCLNGPPGTGKTVLLVLQALRWLRLGHRVHVVSTRHQTFAACCLVRHQLLHRLQAADACADPLAHKQPQAHERVPMLHYDFNRKDSEVDRAVGDLLAAASAAGGDLCVIMDEVLLRHSHPCGPRTQNMVSRLSEAVPGNRLYLWCACVGYVDIPQCLQSETLTDSLRCAPSVLRQVLPGLSRFQHVKPYDGSTTSAPCDGPDVIYVHHAGDDHEGPWPVLCQQCGKQLARKLAELGVADSKKSSLSWRDVFVITRSDEVGDDVTDSEGRMTSRACGLVRGLRACAVPVRVLGEKEHLHDEAGWRRRVEEVARGGGEEDAVTVAVTDYVLGLERRVVVWVVGRAEGEDEGKAPEHAEANDRVFIVSRCTAQLVIVTPDDASPAAVTLGPTSSVLTC